MVPILIAGAAAAGVLLSRSGSSSSGARQVESTAPVVKTSFAVSVDGSFRTLCTCNDVTFWNATVLPSAHG